MLDLPPPVDLWVPPKPAIIRPATAELLRAHDPLKSSLPGLVPLIGGATPKQPIEFVGAQATTVPTHQAGDLILCAAAQLINGTIPTLASGWTNIYSISVGSIALRLAFIIAAAPGTAAGTWTNSTERSYIVYRNASGVGTPATGTGSSGSSRTYPALTLIKSDGSSWCIRVAVLQGWSDATLSATGPSGYTLRAIGGITAEETTNNRWGVVDSNAGVASVSSASQSHPNNIQWRTASIELLN